MDLTIDRRELGLEVLRQTLSGAPVRLRLSGSGRRAIQKARDVIEEVLRSGQTVYGVNTGFGKLSRERVSDDDLEKLQINLLRSHACGVGDPLPPNLVRAILLLRIRALVQGHSGVRVELVETMLELFNRGILAVVPSQGSVGASGDLAPLAHLALSIVGEADVTYNGRVIPASEALRRTRVKAVELQAKEGLALINGTQVTCALGADALVRALNVAKTADLACAMSVDATKGTDKAFDARIHKVRGQVGQRRVAANLRRLLKGSSILRSHKGCGKVQDAYSFRCAPQVHGAARDSLEEARRVFEIEFNAVTDNPLVFPEQGEVISGGNFHAQPVAAAADRIAAVVTDLASISERRIENMVNPDLSGLPAFLTPRPGLCSGFMILQVVAAALVSECKALSHPAAVDSIPTSANKEDHVSMGPIAARKARDIVGCAERVLAIEILSACQALDFEKEQRSSRPLDAVYRWIRRRIPSVDDDRSTSAEIERVTAWVNDGTLLEVAGRQGGKVD